MAIKRNSAPVVFFVFKRPGMTRQFLEIMKSAGIGKIYVFGDGPRNSEEKVLVSEVGKIVTQFSNENSGIKIIPQFSQSNHGLKKSIVRGLTAVFEREEKAIILEDDCLPTPDFFRFTNEMLDRYAHKEKVMSVHGTSMGGVYEDSYAFTKYSQCWGWGTWKRAWRQYDPALSSLTRQKWAGIAGTLKLSNVMRWYWYTMLTVVKAGRIDTWDFQWSYAHFVNSALAVSPSVNLIRNIGFDAAATNTKVKTDAAGVETGTLEFPLRHPAKLEENLSVSERIEKVFYKNPVAIGGLVRQYLYWKWGSYADRH